MQPADFTSEFRPDIYPTLPCLDIQFQWHRASESEVSSECHLDDFDVVPTRERHFVQCQCLPCDGTRLPTIPYNGRSFRVNHRIPWWCRVLHIEPITHQEVKILQGRSPPDVSELQSIAATSELFKHQDLDATLVVHATERKHEDRYHFAGTSLFLTWLLSFWQSWYATVIRIYSETSYTKSVVPHNLS